MIGTNKKQKKKTKKKHYANVTDSLYFIDPAIIYLRKKYASWKDTTGWPKWGLD